MLFLGLAQINQILPSLRVTLKGLVTDEDYIIMRLQELELLDEKRKVVFDHMKVYQETLSKIYNKKVHPKDFSMGDLVLQIGRAHV